MNTISLPDFFIVGAAKAGTTSLYQYLKQHPEIYLPPIKEVNFFCSDIQPKNFRPDYARSVQVDLDAYINGGMKEELFHGFIQNWEQYKKIFAPASGKKAIGELSNTYLYSETAAKNIYDKFPDAKIIMVLRNPIDRAYSHYQMDFRNGLVTEDFITAFNNDRHKIPKGWGISNLYYELGLYFTQVKRFTELFPPQQMKIFLYDEMVADEKLFYKNICEFLKVDSNYSFNLNKKYNQGGMPSNALTRWLGRHKKIKKFISRYFFKDVIKAGLSKITLKKNKENLTVTEKEFLIQLYETDVLNLQKLLKKDLSKWLK